MAHETTTQAGMGSFYQQHIARIKNLDPEVWELLVSALRDRLHSDVLISLRKRGLPDDLADDVEQETWVTALRKIAEFVWEDDERFYNWLRSISLYSIYELGRDDTRVTVMSDYADNDDSDLDEFLEVYGLRDAGLEEMAALRMRMVALDQALRVLEPKEREIFVRWGMGEKPRFLAAVYQKDARSISQMLRRAKQKVLSNWTRLESSRGRKDSDD